VDTIRICIAIFTLKPVAPLVLRAVVAYNLSLSRKPASKVLNHFNNLNASLFYAVVDLIACFSYIFMYNPQLFNPPATSIPLLCLFLDRGRN